MGVYESEKFRVKIATNSFYLPSDSKIGVGYVAHYLANALVSRGNDVTMLSPAPPCEDALYEHRQINAGPKFRLKGFAGALRRLDFSGFDVLHSHGEDHRIHRNVVPCHVRTIHGCCLEEAWHIHGAAAKIRMIYIAFMEIIASLRADASVAVSLNTTRFYPWIRRVIPNGVDLDLFRPGMDREREPTVLFVGTYENRKRGRLLMDTFLKEIKPALPDTKLWMVCSDAPEADGVTVFGRISSEQLAALYRRAWVFCLPSSYEGFGVPYIEALASGTPVVATPNPGACEVLENGRLGLIVKPEELGRALISLLRDEKQRKQLSSDGLERARDYGWDLIAAQYERLYREVLSIRAQHSYLTA